MERETYIVRVCLRVNTNFVARRFHDNPANGVGDPYYGGRACLDLITRHAK